MLNGPRYVVTCKKAIDTNRLKVGTRVALDFSTLTIMRILPREIDPVVFSMIEERNLKLTFKKYKKYFTISFFYKIKKPKTINLTKIFKLKNNQPT